ncbi:alpha/beta hydrolase [Aestuariicella hydrocarbonica]|uniref:Alpha/beta hydrolase n=1 Tax=Pseudomaricurvus hydrocarbonicus TaxID=1470433 RepID=A0A9E5T383_9GAMM|nr:alpha/beta hydrolase [Aestuariicella hydrocarbonica]NHO68536.1 alpha/beta hydrolase [Aestuariicella hydrocarbonica]
MATYVLVHGGGHGGWCYRFVARWLREKGHDVYTPTLTGLSDRSHLLSPAVDLNLHITDIVNLLNYEELTDVILVGHSYGGMVITGVADRATDRIGNVVYLDAAYPMNGQSLADVAPEMMSAAHNDKRVVDGVELVLFPGSYPMTDDDYYGVTDPALIDWMKPKLSPHPWACFTQKLELVNEAAMRQLPQSFIACSANMQDEYREALQGLCQGRFWEIDTGHDLMITEPAWVANVLQEISLAGESG